MEIDANIPAPDLRDSIIHVQQTIRRRRVADGSVYRATCHPSLTRSSVMRFPTPGNIHALFSKTVGSDILQRFLWPAVRTTSAGTRSVMNGFSVSARGLRDAVTHITRKCDVGHSAYIPHERKSANMYFGGDPSLIGAGQTKSYTDSVATPRDISQSFETRCGSRL